MTRRTACLLAALCLLVLSGAAQGLRRALIRSFFIDGPHGVAPVLTGQLTAGSGLAAAARVRVVLLDGLGREHTAGLPALQALCEAGLDLVVDVGFPTVSLPVQHVLWTGLTQQQSGIQYRVSGLDPPVRIGLPGRIQDSQAVAESHAEIVHSFAFGKVLPSRTQSPQEGAAWRRYGFQQAALELARSEVRLGFVHVLRIDEAGHQAGPQTASYRQAAQQADALLSALVAEDRRTHPAGGTAWFVLSDHGHRRGGGHGDAEDEVRLVRACIAGIVPTGPLPPGRSIHLVDLARALAEAAGVPTESEAAGRTLSVALDHPERGATLPRPSAIRWAIALLVLVASFALGVRAVPRAWAVPLWLPLACACVVALDGPPTLSSRAVYAPMGRNMLVAASPGLLLLLATMILGLRCTSAPRLATAQLALPVGAAVAVLVLCGALERIAHLSLHPPLVPFWTGRASLLLTLCFSGAAVAALPVLVAAVRGPSDPSARAAGGGRGVSAP